MPFNHGFLDERLDQLYRVEQRTGTIMLYFSGLTIFISCLGLFGLASYMAEQRTREIGIRKVLGASVSTVVLMLSKEFMVWVLVANLIAWPCAWWAMNDWLQTFAYRTEIGSMPFILSGLLAVLIALITISYQSIKAALANPVDTLQYE